MRTRLKRIFGSQEVRTKLLFTMFVIFIYRVGSHIHAPGVDLDAVASLREQSEAGGIIGLFDLLSGGALVNYSIFALGLGPYITASIVLQLLAVAVPKLQTIKEGPNGQQKINEYTRYGTVALAFIQAISITVFLRGDTVVEGGLDVIGSDSPWRLLMVASGLTLGSIIVMWLGEQITNKGVGNGISILIAVAIVVSLPYQGATLEAEKGRVFFAIAMVALVALTAFVLWFDGGQRRIPVVYTRSGSNYGSGGAQRTYIPLKINLSSVIPVIFASSIISGLALLARATNWGWTQPFDTFGGGSLGFSPWYLAVLAGLTILFTFFYNNITFNPEEQAENLRTQGGYIPGHRVGKETEEYLARSVSRISLVGGVTLAAIAVVPVWILSGVSSVALFFGGTSILILAVVTQETIKQVEGLVSTNRYESFIK